MRSYRFLIVEIHTEGSLSPEIIINSRECVADKLAHYNSVYDDHLEQIESKSQGRRVRITDAWMTNQLRDLAVFFD